MTPIEFDGQTHVLAKDQPEYRPLPVQVYTTAELDIAMLSCWELTDEDIEILRQTRKLWLSQLTFGNPLQPQLPSVTRPE